MFVCPTVVGAGKRFFPDGVRLKPELVDGTGSLTVSSFLGTLSVADTLAVKATSRGRHCEGPL
jgi:hypothetical protein